MMIITAMIIMPTMANAQISVSGKSTRKTIKTTRMGWVELSCIDGYYYFLSITSDNRFDRYYTISLGKGKAEAVESLQSLISIASSLEKGQSAALNTITQEYIILKGSAKGEISIKGDLYSGYGDVSKKNLEKLLKALISYKQK